MAALSWETLWQLASTLALGVSAQGTAITLAATMGGMTAGSWLAARFSHRHPPHRPLRLYGLLELVIGLSGLLLLPGFGALESLDTAVYQSLGGWTSLLHLSGIVLVLGPPTLAMGATVPLFGLVARQYGSSLSLLYAANTSGAALGPLLMALLVLPATGVTIGVQALASVNILVCLCAWLLPSPPPVPGNVPPPDTTPAPDRPVPFGPVQSRLILFTTGLVAFALEVAWFRALRSAFHSTSDTFAILLASVLGPLALAARLVPWLRRRRISLPVLLAGAAILILLATVLLERLDILGLVYRSYWKTSLLRLACALGTMGPPMLLLGVALPWLLDAQDSPSDWGRLYALDTLGAIGGSLLAAWVLLPTLGFARTCWLAGVLLGILAVLLTRSHRRLLLGGLLAGALVVAVLAEPGIGRERVFGRFNFASYQVLAYRETPDSTVSVIERPDGERDLVIDGFETAGQGWEYGYMTLMGQLPMMLHPDPKDALVICFGTGQTANAVRREGPQTLDLVDLNQAVFELSDFFKTNEGVVHDPRVHTIVMDGRAWLRRTSQRYDVITLEPMPPTFAGINALYSIEFYELILHRLKPGGVVAQWLPLPLVHPYLAACIAAAFQAAFPDSILWLDPVSKTGILLGRREGSAAPLGADWPGLRRSVQHPLLDGEFLAKNLRLDRQALARFAAIGTPVTDDNQVVSFTRPAFKSWDPKPTEELNLLLIKLAAWGDPILQLRDIMESPPEITRERGAAP